MSATESGQENPASGSDWWADLWSQEEAHEIVVKRKMASGTEETVTTLTLTQNEFQDFEDLVLYVKEHCGGGQFVIYRRGEMGRFQPGSRKQFACSGPVRRFDENEKPQAQTLGLAELMLQMQERSDARMEKLLEKMADKPSGDDELARLERYANIVSKNTQPVQKAEKSLIEQAMEKQILSFMESGMGGAKEEAGFGWVKDLVMEFGPALASAAGLKGGEAPVAEVKALPDPAEVGKATMLQKLKLLLTGMVQLAGYNVPPGETVEKIKEQAGEHWPSLLAVIQRPDAVDMASQLQPAVLNHREWFEGFRAAVLGGKKQGATGGRTSSKSGTAAKKPAKRGALANG